MTERWDRLVPPVVAPTAHLAEEELAAVELTVQAAKHVAECSWCRTQREALSNDERDELEKLLSKLDAAPAAEDVLNVASGFTVPAALASYVQADPTYAPEVAPAQLWRMAWNGQDALGVVLEKNSWWVTVAPLTTDLELADEYTAVCSADATSLSYPTAVFMRAATSVPAYTLAHFLGELHPKGVDDPVTELRRLQRACVQGIKPPDALPTGRPLQVDDWDRQEALDGLVALMSWFESATSDVLDEHGAIVGGEAEDTSDYQTQDDAPGAHGRHRGESTQTVDVMEALKSSKKDLRELVESTGLEPARVLDFLQGGGKPTATEREALGHALGVQVTGAYSDVARLALLEVLSEPENRNVWRAWPRLPYETELGDDQSHQHNYGQGFNAGYAFGHGVVVGPRHASEPIVMESLRPCLEQMLTQSIAARSVPDSGRGERGNVDVWRDFWRDRLAHRKR